ncbi:MAG: hypothetical protein HOV80_11830 [Polyangiaceae bacterium]|nr:hypothetical protein [Polyangiaceae bacterium]
MQTDRRALRSSDTTTALSLFLVAERGRRGARVMTLGTLDGRLVASSGGPEPSRIAAAGSLKLRGIAAPELLGDLARFPFYVTVVHDKGEPLLLTCVGGEDRAGAAEPHVDRILSQ